MFGLGGGRKRGREPEIDWAREIEDLTKSESWLMSRVPEGRAAMIDLGCGGAFKSELYARKFPNLAVDALDVAEDVRKYVKEREHIRKFILRDMLTLDVSEAYEIARMSVVNHFFKSEALPRVFAKVHEILKPEGILGGTFVMRLIRDGEPGDDVLEILTPERLKGYLETSGFTVELLEEKPHPDKGFYYHLVAKKK